MEVVAGDSGVETEFDLESNDSSMSGLSGGTGVAVPLQPLPEVMIMIMMMMMSGGAEGGGAEGLLFLFSLCLILFSYMS